jgi:hypothetical protein
VKSNLLGISAGGEKRLRVAMEEQVRREFQRELSEAADHWAKVAVEEKIEMEVKERMKRVASPQSLWNVQ